MKLLAYLSEFLSRCIHWVAHVGKDVLNRKGLPVEYFANNVSSGSVPLDTLGLLCIARNWHIHICVFLQNGIWTTRHDNSLEGVEIFLAYVGGLNFVDTVHEDYLSQNDKELVGQQVFDLICTSTKTTNLQAVDLSTKSTAKDTTLTTEGPPSTKQNIDSPVESSTKSTKDVDSSTNVTDESPSTKLPLGTKLKKNLKCKKKKSKDISPVPKKVPKRSSFAKKKTLRSRLDNPYLKLCQGKSTLHSRKALYLYTLDDLLSKKRKPRAAKPKNLKEKDPILKGVKDSGDQIDIDIMLQPDEDKEKKSAATETEIKTDEGKMSVLHFGLVRPKKKTGTFKCSNETCTVIETTPAGINKHEKDEHSELKYNCKVCDATNFSSYQAAFKHEQRHFKLLHICEVCNKDFQFPNQLEKHKAQHDKMKGLPCMWRGCKKILSSKDALNQHVLCHRDEKLKCDLCPDDATDKKTYPTIMSLKQHKQGSHGKGTLLTVERCVNGQVNAGNIKENVSCVLISELRN